MNNQMLIGLHGKPRVGKDTLANYLIEKHKLLKYGPSVRVKDTTAAMFDIPRWWLDDDTMKEHYDEFWKMTVRQMAQKVGKESSRDVFGDDIWMRHVARKLQAIQRDGDYSGIILADIRYASEIEWVKKNGGDVIFILRTNAPKTSDQGHVVDQGLPTDLADMLIYNNGTKEELYSAADRIMASYFSF